MTHEELIMEIGKMREALHKRLVRARVSVQTAKTNLAAAEAAFHRVRKMASVRTKFVKTQRHQELLAAIDKEKLKFDASLKNLHEVEEEHKAYFRPIDTGGNDQ